MISCEACPGTCLMSLLLEPRSVADLIAAKKEKKNTRMLASNSPFIMMMITRMTTMVMMKPQSPLFWAHASKLSSILLHQTCIMSVCFKTHDTVELIGADSCIRGRAECVALSIRYGFYVRRCWFMDVCDFSRPHISSVCVLTCTLISGLCVIVLPASARAVREAAFMHLSFHGVLRSQEFLTRSAGGAVEAQSLFFLL